MSVAARGKGAQTPNSEPVSDLFDDEERVGGLLKSLINPQGLNTAWQRIAKRLQTVELGLKNAQDVLARLPQDYVSQAEFREAVRERHEQLLQAHDERLRKLEELSAKLSDTVFQDHGPKLKKCMDSMGEVERTQSAVVAQTNEMQRATEALQAKVASDVKTLTENVTNHQVESLASAKDLKDKLDGECRALAQEIKDAEERTQKFTHLEIQRSHEELTRVEDDEDGRPSDHQAKMLEFVGKHIAEPLHRELQDCREQHEELKAEVGKQKDDFTREIRGAQKTAVDAGIRMKQVAVELKTDLDMRPKRAEVQKIEGVMSTNINVVSTSMNSLQSKVTMKLNEFLDHFGKLHETIDDHEHCLRHHAEEIENRSTKYELLTCQHQLDRYALKDDFLRESAEVRKLLNWQTSKIEGFSLMSTAPKKKVVKVQKKPTRKRLSPGTDFGDDEMDVSGMISSRSSVADDRSTMAKRHTVGSIVGSIMSDGTEARFAIPEDAKSKQSNTTTSEAEDQEPSENDETSTDESDSMPSSSLLRQQLECVSMGLVSLAHLALKEMRLGTSRNAKLLVEKELLEELLNLRHWISSRMAPSGWDPSKLTTFALRCSHPREDEVQLPAPRLPPNGVSVLGASDELRSARKRFPSAEPSLERQAGGGAKIAPPLAVKTPLSARTSPTAPVGGPVLPPLQTVAAM